jgi:hypothetical protein
MDQAATTRAATAVFFNHTNEGLLREAFPTTLFAASMVLLNSAAEPWLVIPDYPRKKRLQVRT